MDRKESRPKAAESWHAHHTAPLYPLRRRLSHWLCPECVFNADMSIVIDSLAAEVERLRDELAACRAGGAR